MHHFVTAPFELAQGPSSKVRTTSLSRRKSYCLKCSKPNPGPPVASISTMRERPIPPGLSHAGILLTGLFWPDAFGAGALAAEDALVPQPCDGDDCA